MTHLAFVIRHSYPFPTPPQSLSSLTFLQYSGPSIPWSCTDTLLLNHHTSVWSALHLSRMTGASFTSHRKSVPTPTFLSSLPPHPGPYSNLDCSLSYHLPTLFACLSNFSVNLSFPRESSVLGWISQEADTEMKICMQVVCKCVGYFQKQNL